ncbi:MAG: UDP-N-acetylmuramate--L-alanine ligase [Planctomycetes bacterium]|nr:UDP-N-acetylmuramate--L-alanine ligase [Planctomycetota bacterium]
MPTAAPVLTPAPTIAVPRPQSRPSSEQFDPAGKHAYFIGIGGCGMSGLARMLRTRGAVVSGSDKEQSSATDTLSAEGIAVGFDQSKQWLPEGCDFVVASAAVKPDHPQMLEAERRGIPIYLYAEALGKSMIGSTGVAVAGTHGKSTTTAMLGCALTDAGLDPSVIVGATSHQLVSGCLKPLASVAAGFRLGSPVIPTGEQAGRPGVLVAEACEYNRSFHNFRPTAACISGVEADHLDVYGTLDAVVESFHEFARLLPPAAEGGYLLIGHDGAHRREVTAGLDCAVETIGFSPAADWVVGYDASTRGVTISRRGRVEAAWTNTVAGAHNAVNAATAFVLARRLGADPERLAASLSRFSGIDRRMQLLGERPVPGGTVRVIDDYGHHPTEIEVTLRALREAEAPEKRGGRLICVFQPHQHSRTRHLLEEFAASFSHADVVIVPHIYFVRDSLEEKHKVTSADLVDRLREKGVRAMHLYPFEAIIEQLETMCRAGEVVVTMGAGDVWKVAKGYLEA